MITIPHVRKKKTAVFGLGATGLSAAQALAASGAQVYVWDESEAARSAAKNTAYAPEPPDQWPWPELEFLVLSPGVPLTHPAPHDIVARASAAGVAVLGDLELFAAAVNASAPGARPTIIGVTGSNGKSTTTALITHILRETGRDVQMGGNIGVPVLSLDPWTDQTIFVLELSSYQLDLASSLRANVSVFLNISPDHLDRHGDMAGYLAAKQRIFYNQTAEDVAIVGVDDPHSQGVCAVLSGRKKMRVMPISTQGALGHGVYALDGRLFYAFEDKAGEAGSVARIPALRGPHNWQNASAAMAATSVVGVAPSVAVKAMSRFEGLAHRMETVLRIGKAVFVNDSKATNAEAARRALQSFDDVFWICGGVAKEGGLAALKDMLPRVRTAYLIGEAATAFEEELAGVVPCIQCGNLAAAVSRAARDAALSGLDAPAVMLSPACASFDQFKNFEERGESFRRLVKAAADAAKETEATPGGAAA